VCELEKIVGGADDGPLGAHLVEAAHQKLAEPAGLLDLAEHRLGELLAQPVGLSCPPALIFARMAATRVGVSAGWVVADAAASSAVPAASPATASLARPVAT
jgi:dipeptide/tripeptide permease